MPQYLDTPQGRRIAYNFTAASTQGVMFLGGFRSDMQGTKAMFLETVVAENDLEFVRFDYAGHGLSGGDFADFVLSDWVADAAAVLALMQGRVILVGSSMGGWIALLLARRFPEKIAALIGVAAAPDFTEDLWQSLAADDRDALMRDRRLAVPDPSGTGSYPLTRRLIEDGRRNLVLQSPLHLPFAVHLLHGTADADVPMSVPLRLLAHATGPNIRMTLIKDADHRFSSPLCLETLELAVETIICG